MVLSPLNLAFLIEKSCESTIGSAEAEAKRIMSDALNAESKKKDILLEARMKFTVTATKPSVSLRSAVLTFSGRSAGFSKGRNA